MLAVPRDADTSAEAAEQTLRAAYGSAAVTVVRHGRAIDDVADPAARALVRRATVSVDGIVAVPLVAGSEVVGVLTLPATIDEEHRLIIATCVASHLHAALTVEELEEALSSRDVIGQAKGVLMVREGVDADAAFELLRQASQQSNVKVRDLAARVVEQVTA